MHKISGGISNLIMKVAPSAGLVAPVVFKVFGDKTELLVDRDKELLNLIHLNAAGFGAQARYVRNHNDWRSWVSLSQLHSSHASWIRCLEHLLTGGLRSSWRPRPWSPSTWAIPCMCHTLRKSLDSFTPYRQRGSRPCGAPSMSGLTWLRPLHSLIVKSMISSQRSIWMP